MKVSLIGAGGHARTLISILELLNIEIKGVYDDAYNESMKGEMIDGYPLLGGLDRISNEDQLIISKGETAQLKELSERYSSQILQKNLIHPKAVVESVALGNSNQISALSYMAKTAAMGSHNIIYSQSSIEHEVQIGDHNVITVNVAICGRVKIGNRCFLGASSTILPKVSICDDVTIGAGAVVTTDITEAGTYIGIPAKKMREA